MATIYNGYLYNLQTVASSITEPANVLYIGGAKETSVRIVTSGGTHEGVLQCQQSVDGTNWCVAPMTLPAVAVSADIYVEPNRVLNEIYFIRTGAMFFRVLWTRIGGTGTFSVYCLRKMV
jgi:hypothetical protein